MSFVFVSSHVWCGKLYAAAPWPATSCARNTHSEKPARTQTHTHMCSLSKARPHLAHGRPRGRPLLPRPAAAVPALLLKVIRLGQAELRALRRPAVDPDPTKRTITKHIPMSRGYCAGFCGAPRSGCHKEAPSSSLLGWPEGGRLNRPPIWCGQEPGGSIFLLRGGQGVGG